MSRISQRSLISVTGRSVCVRARVEQFYEPPTEAELWQKRGLIAPAGLCHSGSTNDSAAVSMLLMLRRKRTSGGGNKQHMLVDLGVSRRGNITKPWRNM